MTDDMKSRIAEMQKKRAASCPRIWQNPNGTWSNHKDSKREWEDREGCATDLRFAEAWEK